MIETYLNINSNEESEGAEKTIPISYKLLIMLLIFLSFNFAVRYDGYYSTRKLIKINSNNYYEDKNLVNYNRYYLNNYVPEIKNFDFFNITHVSYYFSFKYKVIRMEYNIAFYEENEKLITPSDFALYKGLQLMCTLEIDNSNNLINSYPNVVDNKYYQCVEYFNIHEKVIIGIKLYQIDELLKAYSIKFFTEAKFNYNNFFYQNDNLFDPYFINDNYIKIVHQINENKKELTPNLKKDYLQYPYCSLKRNSVKNYEKWYFRNIYNDHFCFCVGTLCLLNIDQNCKHYFFLNVIDKNQHLYKKTDFLFVDFIFSEYSYDDTYPIFKEMLKRNYPVHYMTENSYIYDTYCYGKPKCELILYATRANYTINGDFIEKYLTLFLKLKAVVCSRQLNFYGNVFYNTDYIQYITIGHSILYFKYFSIDNDFAEKRKFDKLMLPPSERVIKLAKSFGWNEDDILQINFPRWDKYNNLNYTIGKRNISSNNNLRMMQENNGINNNNGVNINNNNSNNNYNNNSPNNNYNNNNGPNNNYDNNNSPNNNGFNNNRYNNNYNRFNNNNNIHNNNNNITNINNNSINDNNYNNNQNRINANNNSFRNNKGNNNIYDNNSNIYNSINNNINNNNNAYNNNLNNNRNNNINNYTSFYNMNFSANSNLIKNFSNNNEMNDNNNINNNLNDNINNNGIVNITIIDNANNYNDTNINSSNIISNNNTFVNNNINVNEGIININSTNYISNLTNNINNSNIDNDTLSNDTSTISIQTNEVKVEEIKEERFIFLMFAWRNIIKDCEISSYYFKNLTKLLTNENLNKKLKKNNVKIYFTIHGLVINKYRNTYKSLVYYNPNIKFIEQNEIANTIAKSSLIITDYSSLAFDYVYMRRPYVLYIPDIDDPNITAIYKPEYYDFYEKVKEGTIRFENMVYSVKEVVDRVEYYIDNDFILNEELQIFYDSFGIKKENNTDKLIKYLINLD